MEQHPTLCGKIRGQEMPAVRLTSRNGTPQRLAVQGDDETLARPRLGGKEFAHDLLEFLNVHRLSQHPPIRIHTRGARFGQVQQFG